MSARLDTMLNAFRALDVRDDPARTAPPDDKEGTGRRWYQLSESEKRRTVQHWLLCHVKDADGFLSDLLSDLDPLQLLTNFANGEDMLNGVLVNRLFMKLGQQIEDDVNYVL